MNFIRPQLATVAGAQFPYPYGGATRQVQIDLDQNALRAHNLSAADVGHALALQNQINPVGTEKIGPYEFTVDLNDSPKAVADFNNLPVKVVNGTVVFMRDVAYVHDGSPPQTNVVQLDGRKGVLMSVLKIGSASTLDIISGIKARLPAIEATLPPGVNLKFVGDQSDFVKSSVAAVVREGLIAATLTGLMILVFLGSWRSTLIITVSIPLAVLSSLTALSLLGQTINVMTLGGLALAVGILVDDATVTIENINRHMEHGEDILTAITTGAQEIMPPATVALFCICIAFVPLLALGGVAGYLFRPLAMAVVFAMIASYILTYTLVPTMAHFLLKTQHHSTAALGRASPRRSFSAASSKGSKHYFERFRQGYLGVLRLALQHRFAFAGGFVCFALLSFGLAPFLGQDFFLRSIPAQSKSTMRAPTGTRIEETTRLTDEVEQKIRSIIPPDRLASIVNNIGLPVSGINLSYQNTGTIGVFDADMLVSMREGATPDRRLRQDAARAAPEGLSGRDILFPSGGYGQPNSQLRLARAARRPDRRQRSEREPRLRQQALGENSPCSRNCRSAHPGGVPGSCAQGRLQSRIRRRRRAHRERRFDQPPDDALRQHPDGSDLLAEPATASPTPFRSKPRNMASIRLETSNTCR